MYDGIITTSHQDPALAMKGTLKDGRTVYVVRDEDRESPDAWDFVAELVLVGHGARQYALGTEDSRVTEAHDRFRNGTLANWHETDDAVARYMRMFHNTEVLAVSLQDYTDYANGYVVLDLADAEREGITDVPAALKGTAETWQQYFAGDVYGFIVVDEETGGEDSYWGYYGEPDDLIKSGFYGDAYDPAELESYDWARVQD